MTLPAGIFPALRAGVFLAFLVVLAIVLAIGVAFPTQAQDASPGRSFSLVTSDWQRTFDAVERSLRGPVLSERQRRQYDTLLSGILQDARTFEAEARREIEAQSRLVEALGPAPAEGQPPEPRDVARERKDILDAVGIFRARLAQAELAAARAAALQEQLASAVRRRFLQQLLQRDPSPLAPGVFAAGFGEWGDLTAQMLVAPVDWYAGLADNEQARLAWLLPALLGAAVTVATIIRNMLVARAGRRAVAVDSLPGRGRKLLMAGVRTLANGIIPAVALAVPITALLVTTEFRTQAIFPGVLPAILLAAVFLLVGAALARAALAPGDPQWSLAPLHPQAARSLYRCSVFLAALLAAALGVRWAQGTIAAAAPELRVIQGMSYCTMAALGIVLACRGSAWRRRERPEIGGNRPEAGSHENAAEGSPGPLASDATTYDWPEAGTIARRSIAAVAVAAPLACAFGYTQLGITIIDIILWTSIAAALLLLARSIGRTCFNALLRSRLLGRDRSITIATIRTILIWVRALLDPILLALAVYALAPLWGLPRDDMARWTVSTLSGFTVGGVTISLTDLSLATLVLIIALLIARSARRALAERLLPRTRLDAGVQHSISVGAGYVGVVIASLLAVAVLGVDLSNIALVAGALSVGIGFGLQNIVNNFVSGLILLIERPVKVGDWVVVGQQQGFVKRIHVRSTELETFERATVILPNSDLLSNAVVNWTHKDKIGRLDVRVGVDYGVDTDKVRDVLLTCARSHPEVLTWPQPFVLFLDFADSALIFELRVFLRNVEKRLRVGSDLRFAVEKACREAGIAFPYSQHDIHLRDIDRLEAALTAIVPPAKPDVPRSHPRRGVRKP